MITQTSPITILAGAALEPRRLVRYNGTAWVHAGRGEAAHAVTVDRIPSGTSGPAAMLSSDSIVKIETTGAVAAGAVVYGDVNGTVSATAGGFVVGMHRGTASTATATTPDIMLVRGGLVEMGTVTASNASGVALVAGDLAVVQGVWMSALESIGIGAAGRFQSRGLATVPKPTGAGTDYAVGRALGWDPANKIVTVNLSTGGAVRVVIVPATADTVVVVDLNPRPRTASIERTVSSAEDSANGGSWSPGFVPAAYMLQVLSSLGAVNAGLTTLRTAGVIDFTATAVLNTDVLRGSATEF